MLYIDGIVANVRHYTGSRKNNKTKIPPTPEEIEILATKQLLNGKKKFKTKIQEITQAKWVGSRSNKCETRDRSIYACFSIVVVSVLEFQLSFSLRPTTARTTWWSSYIAPHTHTHTPGRPRNYHFRWPRRHRPARPDRRRVVQSAVWSAGPPPLCSLPNFNTINKLQCLVHVIYVSPQPEPGTKADQNQNTKTRKWIRHTM